MFFITLCMTRQGSPAAPVLPSVRSSLRRPLRGGYAVHDRPFRAQKHCHLSGAFDLLLTRFTKYRIAARYGNSSVKHLA
jgi:hypothetical protein